MHPALKYRRRTHLKLARGTIRRRSGIRSIATFSLVTLGVLALMLVGSVAATAGGIFAAYSYFAAGLPSPRILDAIEEQLPESTYVYDRSGEVLLARFECQNRERARFENLPPLIWQATVASEDRTYWENNGVDFQGTVRAALANLRAGSIVQGASTITQQLIDHARVLAEVDDSTEVEPGAAPAPSLGQVTDLPAAQGEVRSEADVCEPPPPSRTPDVAGKIRENILAMEVTSAYPGREGKERILETYLNLIYYGNGSYGIRAAAANYFGVDDLADVTIAQAAFLAALPQAPSLLDPYQNEDGEPGSEEAAAEALHERDLVLGRMLDEGYITPAEHAAAVSTSWLEMEPSRLTSILLEPHFSYRVRAEAERILAARGVDDPQLAVRTGGYRITTTLDHGLQQEAKRLVAEWVATLDGFNVNNGALVAIDSATGQIVSYVGSVDYYNRDDPRVQGQFDVAGLGRRQPGSAFKPITYTSAFKARQATVSTMLVDALTDFGLQGAERYRPTNADIQERGPVLAVDALRYSLNIPSVMMQYLAGRDATIELAGSLGIASADYFREADPGLSLALGSVPVNLTNMTQAYGAFAQQGTLHPATAILEIRDRDGRIVYTADHDGPQTSQPLTPAEAYLTHWILEGNTDPRKNLLWGQRAELRTPDDERRPAGFKTGTTNDFRDVSGFGYVPGSLVTGVWMGNNNMEPMSTEISGGLFSADGPLYLWHDFMTLALNQPWDWNRSTPVGQTSFDRPDGVVLADVCRWSGMSATRACGPTITVPFLEGTVPARDDVSSRGCLDVVRYLSEARPDRPESWTRAARTWIDRVMRGQTSAVGDPADYQESSRVRFAIVPLHGEPALPPVCGGGRAGR